MDVNTVVTLISSLGFPIVACVALGWYITSEVRNLRKEHSEEVSKMTEAINNNTLVIQRLCDKLDKEGTNEK